jgi:hypothetical protein
LLCFQSVQLTGQSESCFLLSVKVNENYEILSGSTSSTKDIKTVKIS